MPQVDVRRVVALAVLALAGCSEYDTRPYGVGRGAPEQTRVASPAPLSLPPILTEGRARADSPPAGVGPLGSAAAPATGRASFESSSGSGSPPSSGEESLLDASGPSAPDDIRTKVDQDAQIGRADPGYSDALLFGPVGPRGPGGAPIIQRESKSWLDGIL